MNFFVPQKQDKEVISLRLPTYLLRIVDEESAKADISRNEFINQCIEYAVAHLKSVPQNIDKTIDIDETS